MDTSLDNTNNPFTNSNSSDNNIITQKPDGLLLNLSENFKQNGASETGDFYHNNEKANGKRLASEFDVDDEDLGPETDVDAIDDVLSPSIVQAKALAEGIVNNNPDGSFNPFVEKHEIEKAALEIDLDLQKQQSSEFDAERSPRDETPTPPAQPVNDGGLEENLGDSGEESEDEWNYIAGEEANKENLDPIVPNQEAEDLLTEQEDNMSHPLNPNAAEFVPVSPTRSIPSPVCRALINDPVISQSPKRANDIDINVPNLDEFENEVKSRPSDFDGDKFSNGHDNDTEDNKLSSQELMENLLNGKNIDEIPEFQPGSTPTKVPSSNDEFYFGPNAAPLTPAKLLDQSEAGLSTRAVYGDDTGPVIDSPALPLDNVDFTTALNKNKEENPMSMSFYQDKDDGTDPFEDLNKVQMLPDNLDDFLNKTDDDNVINETISDLPEHDPSKDLISNNDDVLLNNDERIQTTDLDKIMDEEKELASPVEDENSGICELETKPLQPEQADLLGAGDLEISKDNCIKIEEHSSTSDSRPESKNSEPIIVISPEPELEILSPEPAVLSPSPKPSEEEIFVKSPELENVAPESSEELCCLAKSPELQPILDTGKESPLEDVTSSVKDVSSPATSPIPDQLNFAQEINTAMEAEAQIPVELSSPIRDMCLIPDSCPISTPKSITDTESVQTADVNSFLERSNISEITSPLSASGGAGVLEEQSLDLNHPFMKCVYPLPTEIKTETITAEFAEPAMLVTPTEPSKEMEYPAVPLVSLEETVKEEVPITAPIVEKKTTTTTVSKAKTPILSAKKIPGKVAAASSAKPLAASPTKPKTTPITKNRVSGITAKPAPKLPSTGAVPKVASTRPAPPKPPVKASTTTTTLSKKPLTNGDVKPRMNLATKKILDKGSTGASASAKPAAITKTASPTKPFATQRPTTAPSRTVTKTAPAAPKPRPTTLNKTTTSTSSARNGTTTTSTTKTTVTKTTTPPKPRPATAPVKPRVPLTRTLAKSSADTEKQNKDSANKLTASRTVTSTRTAAGTASARSVTSTVRKTDTKTTGATRTTTVTKMGTTTAKSTTGKKPSEIAIRNKTKPTKIEAPVQNGVSTVVVTEEITIVNAVNENDSQLMKDNSPIDNKLIVDNNAAD